LTNPATGNGTTSIGLPVSFIDFKAKNDNNNIRLEWTTAQEFNSDRFEIQKNISGNSRDFITAGSIKAAGESIIRKDYNYIDDTPLSGTTYYRIRQVDKDGK